MEAATTLPFSRVRTFNGEVLVDGLRVEDETVVRMVTEREQLGEAADKLVRQMMEVGARVLDREQAGAQADFVKAEFDQLTAEFGQKLNSVFSADDGHVSRILERHFGDESNAAVQNRIRKVMDEVAAQMREDVRKQFTSDSEDNPIAAMHRQSVSFMRAASEQQNEQMRALTEQMQAMRVQMAELKAEKQRLEEVAAAEEKGTAKGRTYEESVYEALDAIAVAQGDDCDAVGDVGGVGSRKGDVVVALDACAGPARGRIVFEAKNSRLSKKQALAELDEAMAARDADFGVFVVPSLEKLPAKTHPLREFNGNKLFVVFDPDDGGRLELEVAYKLARARILMARGEAGSLDPDAVRSEVERALGAMEDVRQIKNQHSRAKTAIDEATKIVEAMNAAVRNHLGQIEALLVAAEPEDDAEE